MKPLILLTGNPAPEGGVPYYKLPAAYAEAVEAAGGLPALALTGEAGPYAGLLLTGGVDADPILYGQRPLPSVDINHERDRQELALLRAFLEGGRPVFGICRGVQLLNIALGGTLVQDLPSQRGISHSDVVHPVQAGHPFSAVWGEHFPVNSHHHQAIDTLGQGLSATAWTADGVVEAVQHGQKPWWGVQWHPERMTGRFFRAELPDMAPLFERFVAQCKAVCGS